MSYSMTHLIVANNYANDNNMHKKDFFLLGSIAPDAVHSRADFSFQLKGDAHDLQKEETWGRIYTEESMKIWYDRLRQFYKSKYSLVRSDDEMLFLQGYVHHIMVDILNCKYLYGKNLIRYNFQVEAMRSEYRKECLMQDSFLRQNHADSEKIMSIVEEAGQLMSDEILDHLGLLPYFTTDHIREQITFHKGEYAAAGKVSLNGLEMISVEESGYLLQVMTQESERMLFDFPPAGNAFEM